MINWLENNYTIIQLATLCFMILYWTFDYFYKWVFEVYIIFLTNFNVLTIILRTYLLTICSFWPHCCSLMDITHRAAVRVGALFYWGLFGSNAFWIRTNFPQLYSDQISFILNTNWCTRVSGIPCVRFLAGAQLFGPVTTNKHLWGNTREKRCKP